MSGISARRRQLYGLGVGVLLLADLAGGAAAVVARASSPDTRTTRDLVAAPARPSVAASSAAPPTVAAPSAAPPSAAPPSDCGHGSATARAVLDRTATGYVLRATVANDSDRMVELDRLVLQAAYAKGVRSFNAGTPGQQIAGGVAETDFALPESASGSAPLSFGVTDFAFHTAGRPECAAR